MKHNNINKMKNILIVSALIFGIGVFATSTMACSQDQPKNKTVEKLSKTNSEGKNIKEIYFAGGCFWGTEHLFQQVRGVTATEVGYANGKIKNPTYEQVISHTTGFTETVKVQYDSDLVDLKLLIDLYFKSIDPTTLNRQGNDVGDNYRSGIYFTNKDTGEIVKSEVARLAKNYKKRVVVETINLKNFYKAENYHQDYLDKNPGGYCHIEPGIFEEARNANPLPKDKK